MKYLLLVFLLIGCGEEQVVWGDLPFIEMEQDTIILSEQTELCKIKPDSVFCVNSPSIGDIRPTKEYTLKVLYEINRNFNYVSNDTWIYNDTVYEHLSGDCEDIASTMAKHMIDDGIDKEWLYLVYRKTSVTEAHMFLAVDTNDGILHLDYANSGYIIEDQINFHLPMTDVSRWIKGNI